MFPSGSSTLDKSTPQAGNTSSSQHPVPPVLHPRRLRHTSMVQMTGLKTHQSTGMVRRLSIAVVSAISLSLGSCATNTSSNSESTQTDASPVATTDELQVVTTFLPVTQFTKAVAGDRVEVTQLLPTNVGPHDFQTRPEDVQRLAQAEVLVQNGLGMEEFLEDLVANASNNLSFPIINFSFYCRLLE